MGRHHLGVDLDIADASTDEVYAAMDWLVDRQSTIETTLARRHLAAEVNPARMALFDLTSAWVEGSHCPLAAWGYSRDGKKNKLQIEYGLLTDPAGRPVAVPVFAGNTADPTAFVDAVDVVRNRFGLTDLVLVGDRGMITSARIAALREHTDLGWLTALRAPRVAAPAADDGPLQLSLFDEPHGREAVPRVCHRHVRVLAAPAKRDHLDVLLAVVRPHDAGHDRHRLVEGVLGHAGARAIEDLLPVRIGRIAAHTPIHLFGRR